MSDWSISPSLQKATEASAAVRGSDALVEKRRADKLLIARMLDMEEAFLTEKVGLADGRTPSRETPPAVCTTITTTAVPCCERGARRHPGIWCLPVDTCTYWSE